MRISDWSSDVCSSDLQEKVWAALRTIPAGETRSYGQVAAAIDSPGAVRAVGAANGANPVWVLVPCHRVVRSDETVGGYGGCAPRQEWPLQTERSATDRSGTEGPSPPARGGGRVATAPSEG